MLEACNNYLKATKKGWKNESGTKKNQSKTRTHTQTHMVVRYKKRSNWRESPMGTMFVSQIGWEENEEKHPSSRNQSSVHACLLQNRIWWLMLLETSIVFRKGVNIHSGHRLHRSQVEATPHLRDKTIFSPNEYSNPIFLNNPSAFLTNQKYLATLISCLISTWHLRLGFRKALQSHLPSTPVGFNDYHPLVTAAASSTGTGCKKSCCTRHSEKGGHYLCMKLSLLYVPPLKHAKCSDYYHLFKPLKKEMLKQAPKKKHSSQTLWNPSQNTWDGSK